MRDTEIIKALERMAFIESRKGEVQKEKVLESAAEIIKSQKAEIESMQAQIDVLWEAGVRLKAEKDKLIKTYKECALEVVKEFAEELKKSVTYIPWCDYAPVQRCIDNLVEEMERERE